MRQTLIKILLACLTHESNLIKYWQYTSHIKQILIKTLVVNCVMAVVIGAAKAGVSDTRTRVTVLVSMCENLQLFQGKRNICVLEKPQHLVCVSGLACCGRIQFTHNQIVKNKRISNVWTKIRTMCNSNLVNSTLTVITLNHSKVGSMYMVVNMLYIKNFS